MDTLYTVLIVHVEVIERDREWTRLAEQLRRRWKCLLGVSGLMALFKLLLFWPGPARPI